MMMRKFVVALSLSLALSSWADERTLLNVDLNDGSAKSFDVGTAGLVKGTFTDEGAGLQLSTDDNVIGEYNISDITKLSIGKGEITMSVFMPDGQQYNYSSVPTLLRQSPESIGDPTVFGLGTVAAEKPADLCDGEFGLYLSLSPSVVNAGTFYLDQIASSVKVQLVKYTEGGREWLFESPVDGAIYTNLNAKTKVQTIVLQMIYEDGTTIMLDYKGVPTDVTDDSMSDMLPDQVYGNELYHYDADNVLQTHVQITGISVTTKKSQGESQLRFTFKTDPEITYGSSSFYLQVSPRIVNQGKLYAPEAGDNTWQVAFGELQMSGPMPHASASDQGYYMNIADNGYIRVDQNEDGSYNIFFDAQFFYDNAANNLTHSGNPSRLIINYKANQ